MKPIVLSGIQPSGNFTIGNYIGAIMQWKNMMEQCDPLFCVVDLHAITVKQDPKVLFERTMDLIALYIASGLDPDKCTLFIQSHVPAHTQLAWILTCMTQMGEMNRMTQFKDKSKKHADNINVGLFSYPILMAADILLYQTNMVPVGDDQTQHIEITRDIAERFNNRFGETFVMPEAYIAEQGARIMSLDDPASKMSKSSTVEKSYISMLDGPDVVMKKLKSATTDSEGIVSYDKTRPGVANLMTLMSTLSGQTYAEIEQAFVGRGYGDFKMAVADTINQSLAPIQKRFYELREDTPYLSSVLRAGALKANKRAAPTLADVYAKIGFIQ